MRRILLLGMAVLLVMVALPGYGQEHEGYTNFTSIAEVKAQNEGTRVALICNENIYVTSYGLNPTFIRDNSGTMAVGSLLGEYGKLLNGILYGTYTKENGVSELKEAEFVGTWENYYDGTIAAVQITEDEYWEHECELVQMPITQSFSAINQAVIFPQDIIDYIPHNTTTITAYVYPTPDKKMRFLSGDFACGVNMELYDDQPTIITSQDAKFKIMYNINRSFKAGCWYTLVTPGVLSSWSFNYTLAEFQSAENGVLMFNTVQSSSYKAGRPYLIKFDEDQSYIYGYVTVKNETPQVIYGGEYNFVGTYSPTQPADGSYYLSANNTIRPLASGGTINGFRAYFEPATPNAAKARAFCIDGMTTAIEDIVGGEELLGIPQKVYTVNGLYAGDDLEDLPKGVYIVNGKKIIK